MTIQSVSSAPTEVASPAASTASAAPAVAEQSSASSIAPRTEGLSPAASMSAGPAIPAVPKGFIAIKC